jgi:hypothetical protein
MPWKTTLEVKVSDDDSGVAYLRLPGHPGFGSPGAVKKSVSVRDIIGEYQGPDITLDFDADNRIIGVEIVGS